MRIFLSANCLLSQCLVINTSNGLARRKNSERENVLFKCRIWYFIYLIIAHICFIMKQLQQLLHHFIPKFHYLRSFFIINTFNETVYKASIFFQRDKWLSFKTQFKIDFRLPVTGSRKMCLELCLNE